MITDEQQKKINAIRENAKDQLTKTRDRRKSPETKEKMKRSAEERWKRVSEEAITFSLEEVLAQAKGELEKSCDVHNIVLEAMSKVEVYALTWEHQWILNYTALGVEEVFKRVRRLLFCKRVKFVYVRTIEEEDKRKVLAGVVKVKEGSYMTTEDYWNNEEDKRRMSNTKSNKP